MTRSRVRRLISLSSSLASFLFAVGAWAKPPALVELPLGVQSSPPERRAAPVAIAKGSVAPGVVTVDAQRVVPRGVPAFRQYTLFDEPLRARAYEKELRDGEQTVFARSDTCFGTPGNFRVPKKHDPRPLEWDTFTVERFTTQTYASDTSAKVIPVRAERWVETAGQARVEATSFWLDLRTGGTRLIARTSTEVVRVAVPFAGVSVHAARTGADSVSFFVRRETLREPSAPEVDLLGLLSRNQFGEVNGEPFDLGTLRTNTEGAASFSDCSFQHVELKLRPEPPSATESDPEPGSAALRPPFSPFRMAPPEMVTLAFAVVLDTELEASGSSEPPVPPGVLAQPHGTASMRTMLVNLGLSRAPGGPQPSVSYRWLDRPHVAVF